ncbi:hypothetical protein DLAC_02509 [Tieghemostelium lacteum]|uniref:Uncharacterized protein n=1 Tax=Tieghemostelium lacteum TaxID=361077 RepID=A0A152A381_TIELA|nr:hypothetical protein DLAC_02509 [Tieghemostelium lacteum]|eukprot:KYR00501.1 hypothetical protein DLAC_02509 [Tieghemostelium lacteum]
MIHYAKLFKYATNQYFRNFCTSNGKETSSTPKSKSLEEYKRTRDQVVTGYNKNFRFSIINLTKAANVAKNKHNLSLVDSVSLGKLMAGVSMCASFLTDQERIAAQIISNKNPNNIYAEAVHVGEVRGYSINSNLPENDDVSVERKSVFNFSKILYGNQKPISSFVSGSADVNIQEDFQTFFDKSEQIPTFISLENLVNFQNGDTEFNGGVLIQSLPSSNAQSLINHIKETFEKKNLSIDYLLNVEKLTLSEILERIYSSADQHPDYDPIKSIDCTFVDFFCRCSLNTFKTKLQTLGLEEILSMKEQNHDTLNCIYCNKNYKLSPNDFQDMINHFNTK